MTPPTENRTHCTIPAEHLATQEKLLNVIQQQVHQGIENHEQPNVSIIYQQSEMHPTYMMKPSHSVNPLYTIIYII